MFVYVMVVCELDFFGYGDFFYLFDGDCFVVYCKWIWRYFEVSVDKVL